MPASGRGSQIMDESGNYEVTTRPLHLFSLLVEFFKGGEYSEILPPSCSTPPLERAAPTGILLSSGKFGNFSRVHIREVLTGSGNMIMGALRPCILSVYLKNGFLQPADSGMSSFENKRDLYLNVLDVTVNMSPLI